MSGTGNSSGNPVADLLNSSQSGASLGSQAQFGQLLQLIQMIVSALTSANQPALFTVYPFTGTGGLVIATAYPGVTSGTFSIRKAVAATTAVTLPTSGGPYAVWDGNGGAAAHNITVSPPGGFTINGGSSYVISTNWAGATFLLDGSNYIAET